MHPSNLKTYEAILKFYKHDATFTPETLEIGLAALEEAVVKEPECPQLWTFLGRLYADNYAMEWIERQTPIEKAIEYAERGVQMNPNNQRARSVLAIGYLLKDQLAEGLADAGHLEAFLGYSTDEHLFGGARRSRAAAFDADFFRENIR